MDGMKVLAIAADLNPFLIRHSLFYCSAVPILVPLFDILFLPTPDSRLPTNSFSSKILFNLIHLSSLIIRGAPTYAQALGG
jgi:hypothetical protein